MNAYIKFNIINCKLVGPHKNVFSGALYLFKKINNNNIIYTVFSNEQVIDLTFI